MKIAYHPAPDRGVQQLMTVGEFEVGKVAPGPDAAAVAMVFGLGVVAGKTSGIIRLLALGAAVAVGYKATR